MLRVCRGLFDKTRAPHKYYKFGYVMDPRKIAPIESVAATELRPRMIRPPCRYVPDVDTFLEKADDGNQNLPDYRSQFTSWEHLMTSHYVQIRQLGVPAPAARAISRAVQEYHKGYLPDAFRAKEERLYFKQFKDNKDYGRRIIPELPQKYRPHQQGIEQQGLPDYISINKMPEWAAKEEARLAAKMEDQK